MDLNQIEALFLFCVDLEQTHIECQIFFSLVIFSLILLLLGCWFLKQFSFLQL